MIQSRNITQHIKKQLFQTDSGYGISFPVVRKENDTYYLASFITLINPIGFDDKIPAPSYWVIADIDTGDVTDFRDCAITNFTTFNSNRTLDVSSAIDYSDKYYDEVYSMFDTVRKELIETQVLNRRLYKLYLKKITQRVPLSYRKFFRDLSI